MKERNINFEFKARYYKLGDITHETKQVWFVLHGYGQLAQYFIKKFKAIESSQICIVAPEGLSKFYLESVTSRSAGGSNRVGATWMTRENREVDIENYIALFKKFHIFLGVSMILIGSVLYYVFGQIAAGVFMTVYPLLAYLYFIRSSKKYMPAKGNSYKASLVTIIIVVFLVGIMFAKGLQENAIT